MTRERFEELKKNGVEKVRYNDIITGFGECILNLKNIVYDNKIDNCKNMCEAQDNFEEPLLVDLNFLYEVENPKKEHIKLTEEQKNIETMHKLLVEALEREKQKDKKIKELEEKIDKLETQALIDEDFIDTFQSEALSYKRELEKMKKENNQLAGKDEEKTNFAIEQLEKVKEKIKKRKDDYLYLKDEIKAISYNQYVDFMNEVEIFELKVDNQIKELKE